MDISVRSLCKEGNLYHALQTISKLQHQGFAISEDSARSLLKLCIKKRDLSAGREVQCYMIKTGLHTVSFLGDRLIQLFALCGSLTEANKAFFDVKGPTIYTWNAIISAHVLHKNENEALVLYHKMQQARISPDIVTILSALKACASIRDLYKGRQIHDQAIRSGLETDALNNSLINTYAKSGSLEDACCIFHGLKNKTIVSWGAIMNGYVENGSFNLIFELFKRMKNEHIEPNRAIFLCLLKACTLLKDFCKGMLTHYEIIKAGLEEELMVSNTLLDMYAKFGFLEDSCWVFEKTTHRDTVSWDVRISGFVHQGHTLLALEVFRKMQGEGLMPNKYTYSCILKACVIERDVYQGKLVHDKIIRCGLDDSIVTMNILIDMYGSCGYITDGLKVFCNLSRRDMVSWGTVIATCVQHDIPDVAVEFFWAMQQESFIPNDAVFISVFKACGMIERSGCGMHIHDKMVRSGLTLDLNIGTTLIDMYGKVGYFHEAAKIFDLMKDRSEVTWGLMLMACVQHGFFIRAINLFVKMQNEGIRPDKASFIYMLKACSELGIAMQCRLLHEQIIRSGFIDDVEIASALVDMYAKSGSMNDAYKLVFAVPNSNAVVWSALIEGFVHSGEYLKACECLTTMQNLGLKPDYVVFTNVLTACTNGGLIQQGCKIFTSMRVDHGIEPRIDDYNTVIDLLSRVGLLSQAEDLLHCMPYHSDVVGWMSLLSHCGRFCMTEMARRCFKQVSLHSATSGSNMLAFSSSPVDAFRQENDLAFIKEQADYKFNRAPDAAFLEINEHMFEFLEQQNQTSELVVDLVKMKNPIILGWAPWIHGVNHSISELWTDPQLTNEKMSYISTNLCHM